MKVIYDKTFNTRISEYLVQVEQGNTNLKRIILERFTSDKEPNGPVEHINIHPDILNDLIESLSECRELLEIDLKEKGESISLEKKKEIRKRYLKGISVKDLSIQFDKTTQSIEKILFEGNIEVISPKEEKPPKFYKKFRKNKYGR